MCIASAETCAFEASALLTLHMCSVITTATQIPQKSCCFKHVVRCCAAQNSNSSQFYVTLAAAPQCDGKHVVVGAVFDGHGILDRIGMTFHACTRPCV